MPPAVCDFPPHVISFISIIVVAERAFNSIGARTKYDYTVVRRVLLTMLEMHSSTFSLIYRSTLQRLWILLHECYEVLAASMTLQELSKGGDTFMNGSIMYVVL